MRRRAEAVAWLTVSKVHKYGFTELRMSHCHSWVLSCKHMLKQNALFCKLFQKQLFFGHGMFYQYMKSQIIVSFGRGKSRPLARSG